MKRLILALGMIVPVLGFATERVMEDGRGNVITLLDGPCVSQAGVLANITPAPRKVAKAASVFWQGKPYEACYLEEGTLIYLIDESGDQGAIESRRFQPKHGT